MRGPRFVAGAGAADVRERSSGARDRAVAEAEVAPPGARRSRVAAPAARVVVRLAGTLDAPVGLVEVRVGLRSGAGPHLRRDLRRPARTASLARCRPP